MAETRKAKPAKKTEELPAKSKVKKKRRMPKFLRAIGGYFRGAWRELRYTKWPTRRSTWSLTLAVILFTVFVMVFIVAIDYGFDALFKRLIA